MRLESGFAVESEEILEITVALPDILVTMLGKVVCVARSKDQGFEFGVSTKRIEHESMKPLVNYLRRILTSGTIQLGSNLEGNTPS